jgi:ABC-type thiamine transport system ATPase subunit
VSLDLDIGMHVVLGTPADGLAALWAVLVGAALPARGVVLVGGRSPARSAEVRRGIASLGPSPCLAGRSVRDATRIAASPATLLEELSRFGLEALMDRDLSSLTIAEQRAVELVFALSHPTPRLLVLYEPGTLVGTLDPLIVRRVMDELATRIPVLVLLSAPHDANALDVVPRILDAGRIVPTDVAQGWLHAARGGMDVVLWDPHGDKAPALLFELAKRAVPHDGASWNASEGEPRLRRVRIETHSIEEVARAVTAIGAELELDIRLIARRDAQALHELSHSSSGVR